MLAARTRCLWPATLILLAGCHGHGTVQIVPLGTRKIATSGPMIVKVTPRECYYWISEKNELCVAMRVHSRSLLDRRLDRDFSLSLVLGEPPTAAARDYRMNRQTARARHDAGLYHARAASLSGITAVWDYGKGRLRGRFRFHAKQQTYNVLVGWGEDSTLLYVGEFEAVEDRDAGELILRQTEQEGAERQSKG